jgi:SAM-dependent methyltransferase
VQGVEHRYLDGTYLADNPEWDRADAPWKARLVERILVDHGVSPASICDVGCGSGDVLERLKGAFPGAALVGFDVSPQLEPFWAEKSGIEFHCGFFAASDARKYDVMLMLDVFEHARDPFALLESARRFAEHFVFHIPLDLSVLSVLRGKPLMHARRKVGHLHFYTKELALETLHGCGYRVLDARYTGAYAAGARSLKTTLAALPRRVAYALNKELGFRLLGGETLLVLAKPEVPAVGAGGPSA